MSDISQRNESKSHPELGQDLSPKHGPENLSVEIADKNPIQPIESLGDQVNISEKKELENKKERNQMAEARRKDVCSSLEERSPRDRSPNDFTKAKELHILAKDAGEDK